MKTFVNIAAQGDLLIRKVPTIPTEYTLADPVNNQHIVAHSETSHHHVVEADDEVEYYTSADNNMSAYLVVKGVIGKALKHLRDFDTHAPILIPPGIYELRRQREYVPEGWRRVED